MGVFVLELVKNYIARTGELSNEEKFKVSEIVSHAIRLTRTHIVRTRKDQTDIPSQILSTTWQEAANSLRRIGGVTLQKFAKTLEEKSRFWSDPNGFKPRLLDEYEMKLTEVEAKLQEVTS
ncbi:hypothetical protein HRG84_19210 [Flavisolibacter sp. BT320]|nr:hypothetical protein [Flavisolibacter longurius]